MTIGDAVNLVFNASLFKKNASVFVLNRQTNIYSRFSKKNDKIIRQNSERRSKSRIIEEVPIKFIGLKEGEKLHEELFITDEIHYTENKDIMVSKEKFINVNLLEEQLNELQNLLNSKNENDQLIFKIVNKLIKLLQTKILSFMKNYG